METVESVVDGVTTYSDSEKFISVKNKLPIVYSEKMGTVTKSKVFAPDGSFTLTIIDDRSVIFQADFSPLGTEFVGRYYKVDDDGTVEEGTYKDNLRSGRWSKKDKDGNFIYQGTYIKGFKNGPWTDYENGVRKRTFNYKKDVFDGPLLIYHKNGKLKSRKEYSSGSLHGPYYLYHSNRKIKIKGAYFHGRRDGRWIKKDREGRVLLCTVYEDGKETVEYDTDAEGKVVLSFE